MDLIEAILGPRVDLKELAIARKLAHHGRIELVCHWTNPSA
jgi:hypothetical protein